MSITSLIYATFCVVSILVYWWIPLRLKSSWLFVVSTGFLLSWGWDLAAILLVSASVNHVLGRWLSQATDRRKFLMWIGIIFNVVVLVALKYNDFYITALSNLLERMGISTGGGGLKLLLPVGLSFVTVQMISYLADVYNRLIQPEPSWMNFALYVIYFPKLLSGPVERARSLLPKLKQPVLLDATSVEKNAWLIVIGLIRKLILANSLLSLIPGDIFIHPESFTGQDLAIFLLAYAFAIYNDFAGYTCIVRGVSGFFGIELSINFNLPYFSRNFTEFWERWHISLSQWLRDYVFFPISRLLAKKDPNRKHLVHLILPPMVTMLVSGMWHGLGWNYIVWGGLFGVYLFLEQFTRQLGPRRIPDQWSKSRQAISALAVFGLVVLTWVPFRMDLATGWHYLVRMFSPHEWMLPQIWLVRAAINGITDVSSWRQFAFPDIRLFIVLIPALWLDWNQHRRKSELFPMDWPAWLKGLFLALTILAMLLLSFAETGAPFIYQGF